MGQQFKKLICFLFSFKGRINRQLFWAYHLCSFLLFVIISLLLGLPVIKGTGWKSNLLSLLFLWPSLAVQAKRWHDRDKSAWWLFVNLIPLAGPLWVLIENGCLSGTPGENRFGEDPLGRNQEALPISPGQWKPGKYYLSTYIKTTMLASLFIFAFGLIPIIAFSARDITLGIVFLIMFLPSAAVIVLRFRTPLIEISETGVKFGTSFLLKTETVKWDEIDGMVVGETKILGFRERTLKILLKSGKGAAREKQISLKAVEKPEEIIERLKAKIPEKRYDDIKHSPALLKPITARSVNYKGWTLDHSGLRKGKETILWDNVKEIQYAGLVIAGYGATTISYVVPGGGRKNAAVQPSIKKDYLDFIRHLIYYSRNASIDPGVIKALEYSPEDAEADFSSIFLFLTGIILCLVALIFIYWYSDAIATGYMNAASLLIPLGLVPLAFSLKVISGRFRGTNYPPSKKILWTALSNVGPFISMPIFFLLSPFSFYWSAGDLSVKLGSLNRAESFYLTALEKSPGNIDVLYEMGKLNRKMNNYEMAFEYLKASYTKDPTYWGPKAVELIPDTLMMMGRYEEAQNWCELILKDQSGRPNIERAINNKMRQINTGKKLNENKPAKNDELSN